jgi:hypothetical protein
MSNFGKGQEISDGGARKLFTGAENFKVVAVNPTKAELEVIYGRELNYDPEYTATTTVSDGDGEREVNQIRLDFYLTNEDVDNPINTKASFYIADTHHKSQTGKVKVINDFGKTTWLTKEDVASGDVPANMSWYSASGLKIAKRGEEEVIDFLVNLLNLPFDLTKVDDISDAYAKISAKEWGEIIKGDVTIFKDVIASTNNKIGVVLGVKTKADGGQIQTIFNRKTMRQYTLHAKKADKFKWILKDIHDAKANGAFGNVDFGADDLMLREFTVVPTQLSLDNAPETEDVFGAPEVTTDDAWLED